jgi:hypothetical protein
MSFLAPLKSAQRPFACGFVDNASGVAHKPHRRNNSSKQRTYDVLHSADIFTRSRQARSSE